MEGHRQTLFWSIQVNLGFWHLVVGSTIRCRVWGLEKTEEWDTVFDEKV